MRTKVGIVLVSYNASTAVRITLASLRQAKNRAASKLILIDNASRDVDRVKIRKSFDRHVAEEGLPWRYLQQETNLGFSGGNNVGIRAFLDDKEISHICLLNSDVIVTDFWLDRLLERRHDIVSAVTNKADSEQCVPIDYELHLNDCLDSETDLIPPKALDRVTAFANNWHQAWNGNAVEADVTFFCVLLSRKLVEKIGLLDETFFPGGYEDDDYCLRARKLGHRIYLARDVFIHHWGSASFGQLEATYFNSNALRNRSYLEQKHGIEWKQRPEKPFVSYAMDVRFALASREGVTKLQKTFVSLYKRGLSTLIHHIDVEFKTLTSRAVSHGIDLPTASTEARPPLAPRLKRIFSAVDQRFNSGSLECEDKEAISDRLESFITAIRSKVSCSSHLQLALSEFTQSTPARLRPTTLSGALQLLKRGAVFFLKLHGLVFFGGYPYPERQSDGYFQRIQIVDALFADRWRVYIESNELPGRNRWWDRPESNVLVLRITGGTWQRTMVRLLALLVVLRCRTIYFHSVLRMRDNRFGFLLRLPGIRKAVDLHGVVPEEFRLHNDFYSALLYEAEEHLAVRKSDILIVVTEAMRRYLQQKYRDSLSAQVITFPMFPDVAPDLKVKPYVQGRPVIAYAGGLQKWQQIPKTIDAIVRSADFCSHQFYCSDPNAVRAMLPEALRDRVIVESKSHEDLMTTYDQCHYGFILREDVVVNRVACPTKLVEYLAKGIVPIVDCEDIGDFKSMGMQSVHLDSLLGDQLPSEAQRESMSRANLQVYESVRKARDIGARLIYAALTQKTNEHPLTGNLLTSRLLPHNTRRGRAARRLRRTLKGGLTRSTSRTLGRQDVASALKLASGVDCDVLVQVDNFEAGGLENVVLDLNATLLNAGYRVVLLVLGTQGPAVQQAEKQGVVVIAAAPGETLYRALIARLSPRLVLAHYSIHGAAICRKNSIPFVQVIHNTYMWFDDHQLREFSKAAKSTTAFIAVSDYAKNYSVERLGIDHRKCIVIPNGIDRSAFDSIAMQKARMETRAKHDIDANDFVFLCVGAINHQKNHIAAVRAFSSIASECPEAKLVILGPVYEGELLDEINRHVAENRLSSKVIYAGSVASACPYYAMADAFVSSSFFEGGPLNQIEAVTANLPSVMTDIGFASYFRGRLGFEIIEPPFEITSFKGRIFEMRSNPEYENRLGAAMVRVYQSRQKPNLNAAILAAMDRSTSYRCYLELIESILNGRDVSTIKLTGVWTERLLLHAKPHPVTA